MTGAVTLTAGGVARMVEFTEAAAYADLLHAAPPDWGCVAEETGAGWVLLAPAVDVLLFNRVIGCGLAAPASQRDVADVIGRYRRLGVRNFGVQLSPAAQPADLPCWLDSDGLVRSDSWTKVYRAAGPMPAATTDLRIEPIGAAQAGVFARVTCVAFGMPDALRPWIASIVDRPHWRHYVAWDGRDAVAVGALFVRGDVGWLGIAGTLPATRRRGAQAALIARRLQDGTAAGCRWFVTETAQDSAERPNPSFHNMLRAGFTVAYHRPNYLPGSLLERAPAPSPRAPSS